MVEAGLGVVVVAGAASAVEALGAKPDIIVRLQCLGASWGRATGLKVRGFVRAKGVLETEDNLVNAGPDDLEASDGHREGQGAHECRAGESKKQPQWLRP